MQTASRQPRKWTLAEDQQLREEVEAQLIGDGEVKDWCRIASKLPGRTNKDCRKRWHNSVAGGLKKGQWSKSEDTLLATGVQQHECAKRWQQSLDPELDRSEWRDEEDRALIEATQQLGRHWKDIQRDYFPGRSKNCIKNRYTVLVRRYQNQGITLPSRASSPFEASTPGLSNYLPDDENPAYIPNEYNTLMPPHIQTTSTSSHHSWSSLDNESISTWSPLQDYNLPVTAPDVTSDYALAPPEWTYATASMQGQPPVSYNTLPAPHHYDDYPQQAVSYSRSPTSASYPGMVAPAVRARSDQQQQHFDSSVPGATYPDPRMHQQNPLYWH